MGLIDEATGLAKTAVDLVRKEGSKDLLVILIDLQVKTLELISENRELRRDVADAADKLAFQGRLQYRDNLYWTGESESPDEGPYCPSCWDTKRQGVRMQRRPDWGDVWCHACQRAITFGKQPPPGEGWSSYHR